MNNCREWFYICLALIGLIILLVVMFMNYNLKLDKRTLKLEKKNGAEMKKIEELNQKLQTLEKKLEKYEKQ